VIAIGYTGNVKWAAPAASVVAIAIIIAHAVGVQRDLPVPGAVGLVRGARAWHPRYHRGVVVGFPRLAGADQRAASRRSSTTPEFHGAAPAREWRYAVLRQMERAGAGPRAARALR
jgi:hypothetical protein